MVYLLSPLLPFSLSQVGLHSGCTLESRLLYSFFHASIYHLLGNCWVLLCVVFYYELPLSRLLIAYLIAITAPTLSATPTVGLSAVVYCLLGQASFIVRRKLYFHCFIAFFILMFGYAVPSLLQFFGADIARLDNFLHIYCYVVGLLVGFLNSPVSSWRRRKQ